ncbi:MAG: endopeptidase La [Candidatus Kapabacteria bacterium]|nr:endopeptidase La [Candidatus Kapabacteria bacterium]
MSIQDEVISTIEKAEKKSSGIPKKLSVLPLRDIVIYPNMIFPVLIGRANSLKAVAESVERDKFIFVSAQTDSSVDEPGLDDIYSNGSIAKIIQILRLPNNLLKVLVEGVMQGRIKKKLKTVDFLEAEIEKVNIKYDAEDIELKALIRKSGDLFSNYVKSNHHLPPDIIGAYDNIDNPLRKLYYAASNIHAKVMQKQIILDQTDLKTQYFELSGLIASELNLLQLEEEIGSKVHDSIQKTQKKYFIQEQIRALQKELGDEEDDSPELSAIRAAIQKADMPEHALAKAMEEFDRLKKTPTMSPEFSVNRTFLEILSSLPWHQKSQDILDIRNVKRILDEDHYNLEKPKERILEFIAVINLSGALRKQILCFVGPPGVGKTSLAKSIARALGRKFVRFSLGGVRDEAEIRGHRRTYIGAMPGKIIQSMKKAGTVNPVILLDEIDKMSMDFRGDPSSALLEVLDPEQNIAFNDHYLEVDYDLSNVMFITTANVRYDIPLPLQDRMEIIELSSYLDPDKLEIAKRHILPRIKTDLGLDDLNIQIEDSAILKIIREYTREAGVRNMEREMSSVLRKLAKEIVDEAYSKEALNEDYQEQDHHVQDNIKKLFKKKNIVIDESKIEQYLKAPRFKNKKEDLDAKVGVATGLAWTSVGGDILPIEVTFMPGAEKLTLTGKLGDVMKESASAGLSYIRSNYAELNIEENFNKKKEIHIHIPEGAIPKDGPSAGITMAIALISAAVNKPIRGDLAMTGEITLRGNILPIGGLKEKLLAAKRHGIKTVIIPHDNVRDIEDFKDEIKSGLEIISVSHIKEAIPHVFLKSDDSPAIKSKTAKRTRPK